MTGENPTNPLNNQQQNAGSFSGQGQQQGDQGQGAGAGEAGKGATGQGQGAGADQNWQDKVKDKGREELVTMYGEAQKKIGELSVKDQQNDELIKQMNIILAAIGDEPEREKTVKDWIQTHLDKVEGKIKPKDKETAASEDNPQITDLRRTQETEIIRRFEEKYEINRLPEDKKKEMNGKIANALWQVADPLGKYEKWEDLVKAIPLAKLETLLERAYFEANRSLIEEKAKTTGEGSPLAMGKIASYSLPSSETVSLTPAEEAVAKKLGIPPEKYLERKKEMLAKKK
jgi:hypothetical protein